MKYVVARIGIGLGLLFLMIAGTQTGEGRASALDAIEITQIIHRGSAPGGFARFPAAASLDSKCFVTAVKDYDYATHTLEAREAPACGANGLTWLDNAQT